MNTSKGKKAVFSALLGLISVFGAAILAEAVLWAVKWPANTRETGYLQFGYDGGIPAYDEDGLLMEHVPVAVRLFESDPDLFWRAIPSTPYTNSQGFRGKSEFSPQKPADTIRIAFLGDSCTFIGDPPYPDTVCGLLAAAAPVCRAECINASCPGYSSFQAENAMDKVITFEPDVLVVYLGWNDHWPAREGLSDSIQYEMGRGTKVIDLIRMLGIRAFGEKSTRVPLESFRKNLEQIAYKARAHGAVPVFITAPIGYRQNQMPSWSYECYKKFYGMEKPETDRIPAVHDQYAQAVRDAAEATDSVVVDAQKAFDAEGGETAGLFRTDRIHLQPKGHELIAKLVFQEIAGITKVLCGKAGKGGL